MVLITQSKRMWLIGMAVSLGIFLLLYFTVIKPDSNAANQALKSGLQPAGVSRKVPALVPVVRQPGDAKTSVHMSSIGSR